MASKQLCVVGAVGLLIAGCGDEAETELEPAPSVDLSVCDIGGDGPGQEVWPEIAAPGGVVYLRWPEDPGGEPLRGLGVTMEAGEDLWLLGISPAHVAPAQSDTERFGPGVTFPPAEGVVSDDGLVRLPADLDAGCYEICEEDEERVCWGLAVETLPSGPPALEDLALGSFDCGFHVALASRRGDRVLLLPFDVGDVDELPDTGDVRTLDAAIEVIAPEDHLPSYSLAERNQACTDVSLDESLGREISATGTVSLRPDSDDWLVVTDVELSAADGYRGGPVHFEEDWVPGFGG